MSQEDKLDWDWRQQFAKLTSDMAKCIELQLHHACETCVNLLPTSNAESMDMTNVDAELVGGRLDYPKQTAKVWSLYDDAFDKSQSRHIELFISCGTFTIQSL